MGLRRCVSLGCALWLAATVFAGPLHAEDLSFTGYARDRQSGALLYVESHLVRSFGKVGETRIVSYRCSAEGPAFARKELTYGAVREEPEFTFVDARSGYTEGLRRTAEGPRVFQQDNARSPRREARIPANAVIVSDAGFDEFVRKHSRRAKPYGSRFSYRVVSTSSTSRSRRIATPASTTRRRVRYV